MSPVISFTEFRANSEGLLFWMGRPPPPPPVFRADTSGPPGLQPASACEKQLTQLQRHVLAFCERVTPGLKNGSYDWLTHVTDVDPRNMAKNIMYALQWGQRDASHGLLFTKRSFVKMNSTLLLWSGVSPSVRAKWCTSLNMFMSPGKSSLCTLEHFWWNCFVFKVCGSNLLQLA